MVDWSVVKDAAAFIGAALSIILVILRFLDARPIVILERTKGQFGDGGSFRLRVRNMSKYPIHIGRVAVVLPWKQAAYDRVWVDDWELRDVVASTVYRRLDFFLGEKKEANLSFITEPEKPKLLLIAVSWYRHQPFIFPTFPKLLFRTGRQLRQLSAHPIAAKEPS